VFKILTFYLKQYDESNLLKQKNMYVVQKSSIIVNPLLKEGWALKKKYSRLVINYLKWSKKSIWEKYSKTNIKLNK